MSFEDAPILNMVKTQKSATHSPSERMRHGRLSINLS
ncbi:hypothetical protein CTO_0956 [Chlamydia trachomatis A2497]|uniref:Uncharacterized protein n=1 Tax=Chlamydia trachomatis serovar A (strain A2497) TaxID=580047 RepID=G4NP31_CHLT4|nr:hypothetical protein CTO_0956 [Chlamydia trachomatis A2497]